MKTIYQENNYRITEVEDLSCNIEDLKGDCYNAEVNKDICPDILKKEELAFEKKVYDEGVFGYCLEKWNPEVDQGWTHIDSCYGFVGYYDEKENNHYIVDELKGLIKEGVK